MNVDDILKQCTIDGNIVRLPDIKLDRKLYLDVAKHFNLIGGKWKSGKIQGFVFENDPTNLFEKIKDGDKINIKKEYQFFETPSDLADKLVRLSEIKETDIILEPSAGRGSIVNAIHRIIPNKTIDVFELMDLNRTYLNKLNVNIIGNDFLTECNKTYDKIIANPPFSKNQDIEHIYKMYEHLNANGRIVTIASNHWKICNNKKESCFRQWLEDKNAIIIDIEAGMFKESGTMISSCILIIDK
jgi:type I restriction-modification system DNA methylase subunit